jgi:hypothetical protein
MANIRTQLQATLKDMKVNGVRYVGLKRLANHCQQCLSAYLMRKSMTKDEALRIALEALEDLGNHDRICPQWPTYAEPENYPKCNCGYDQAITAIKAALEAKDEPFEYWNAVEGWVKIDEVRDHFDSVGCGTIYKTSGEDRVPLYTTPPQRTWVGLTDEQYLEACQMAEGGNYMVAFHRIQQWLKENNT